MDSSYWGTPQAYRDALSEGGVLPAPQPLTFFRILMETVSTKLTGLKSKMTAWKLGWGSPRLRRVGSEGALLSPPLNSITAGPGPASAFWGREGDPASLLQGCQHPGHSSVPSGPPWGGSLAV